MIPETIVPGLILSRRVGEVLIVELPPELGGHILTIACVQVDRNQVKIGVNCPRDWNIYRGELQGLHLAPEHTRPHMKRSSERP
jgi:carbon storage regulator CsrA